MAYASYADDQARSSEGEQSREKRGPPSHCVSVPLYTRIAIILAKIAALALDRCEAVSLGVARRFSVHLLL